jgi:pyruvate/2-oxoacid:ferredoxin oxidoreductase alpha subunit
MMQEKRLRKFKEMQKEIDNMEALKVYGDKNSKTAVIVWGSTRVRLWKRRRN